MKELPLIKNLLTPKKGDDWAKLSGLLRDASKGKGNFGIGAGTRSEADVMGKIWVGEGYTVASDGKTLERSHQCQVYTFDKIASVVYK